jgi:plastocyanin
MRKWSVAAALLGLGTAMGCSGAGTGTMNPTGVTGTGGKGSSSGSSGGSGGGATNAVTVGNNFFSPSTITVGVGTTVTWTWARGDTIHTVTDNADTTIMSAFQRSGTYSRTFQAAGTFPYHCTVHGFAMSGTVIVQ